MLALFVFYIDFSPPAYCYLILYISTIYGKHKYINTADLVMYAFEEKVCTSLTLCMFVNSTDSLYMYFYCMFSL